MSKESSKEVEKDLATPKAEVVVGNSNQKPLAGIGHALH
jgi:hypothetical protein